MNVVVIGEATRAGNFALAGAVVATADGEEAVRAAWQALPAEAAVVVLTPAAAAALEGAALAPGNALRVVLP